jgi:hypothetical protein
VLSDIKQFNNLFELNYGKKMNLDIHRGLIDPSIFVAIMPIYLHAILIFVPLASLPFIKMRLTILILYQNLTSEWLKTFWSKIIVFFIILIPNHRETHKKLESIKWSL